MGSQFEAVKLGITHVIIVAESAPFDLHAICIGSQGPISSFCVVALIAGKSFLVSFMHKPCGFFAGSSF
jgi:hypothetical protein